MISEPFKAPRPPIWKDGDYELAHADFKKQFRHSFECDYCYYHSGSVSHVIHLPEAKKLVLCREHVIGMFEAIQMAGDALGLKVTKRHTSRNFVDVPEYEWDTSTKKWKHINAKS